MKYSQINNTLASGRYVSPVVTQISLETCDDLLVKLSGLPGYKEEEEETW